MKLQMMKIIKKEIEKRKNRIGAAFLSVLLLFSVNSAFAAKGIVFKKAKPQKEIFEKKDADLKFVDEKKIAGVYEYNPEGMTDPFLSFVTIREEIIAETIQKRKRTYLETLELSQLSVSVIVIGDNVKWAMVEDSRGTGHVIKEGTGIGTKFGVVHSIEPGRVVIREEYQDFRGRLQYRDIVKITHKEIKRIE